MLMWNSRSVMFGAARCVMLYLILAGLEFSPAVFEPPGLGRLLRVIRSASIVLVITGFLLNRLSVSITGMEGFSGAVYFPKWTELSVTLSLVGGAFALLALAVRYLLFGPQPSGAVAPREGRFRG